MPFIRKVPWMWFVEEKEQGWVEILFCSFYRVATYSVAPSSAVNRRRKAKIEGLPDHKHFTYQSSTAENGQSKMKKATSESAAMTSRCGLHIVARWPISTQLLSRSGAVPRRPVKPSRYSDLSHSLSEQSSQQSGDDLPKTNKKKSVYYVKLVLIISLGLTVSPQSSSTNVPITCMTSRSTSLTAT